MPIDLVALAILRDVRSEDMIEPSKDERLLDHPVRHLAAG